MKKVVEYIRESKAEKYERRVGKIQRDYQHQVYLEKKGYTPLEIADKLIHEMLVTLQMGLEKEFPEASKDEIYRQLKNMLNYTRTLKNMRMKNGRNYEYP